MKKILIVPTFLLVGILSAQKKKTILSNWKNRDSEIAQKAFSKHQDIENRKLKEEKMNLVKAQRNLKIEILNDGDWDKFSQVVWFRIVKVNNGNLEQIINTDHTDISVVTNLMGTNNWKDEYGGYNFTTISNLMKISQEFKSNKNEKGEIKSALKPVEIYETTEPVLYFSFKIYTHQEKNAPTSSSVLTKTINIYSGNQIIKTFKYSLNELQKIEGVSLRDFKMDSIETK